MGGGEKQNKTVMSGNGNHHNERIKWRRGNFRGSVLAFCLFVSSVEVSMIKGSNAVVKSDYTRANKTTSKLEEMGRN